MSWACGSQIMRRPCFVTLRRLAMKAYIVANPQSHLEFKSINLAGYFRQWHIPPRIGARPSSWFSFSDPATRADPYSHGHWAWADAKPRFAVCVIGYLPGCQVTSPRHKAWGYLGKYIVWTKSCTWPGASTLGRFALPRPQGALVR